MLEDSRNKQIKIENKRRYNQLQDKFLKALRLEFEPVLRPSNPEHIKQYDATRTIHTRVVGRYDPLLFAGADDKTKRLAKQAANHDGYKHAHTLGYANRFNYKACLFVQAMTPSCEPKDFASRIFCQINATKKASQKSYNPEALAWLEHLMSLRATGCFNKSHFLGYRFWFFDLDYQVPVAFEDLCQALDDVGLFPYLAAVVQTSPGKFHLYFHSELIASRWHVNQWTRPLVEPYKYWIYEPEFIKSIEEKSKLNEAWRQVALRGMPNPYDMRHVTTPHRKDPDGVFRGNDKEWEEYRRVWKTMNRFFGGDPRVMNESRIAQLPFYKNPKSNFEAEVMHLNFEAPALSVSDVGNIIIPKMCAYHKKHNKTINPYPEAFAEKEKEKVEEKIKEPEVKQEPVKEPIENDITAKIPELAKITFPESRLPVPAGPEDYAKQNGLSDYVLWAKDITGKSNDMLKALAKWAWKYIDLSVQSQRDAFYERVIGPYFKNRFSQDLRENGSKDRFRVRYESLCKTNLPYNLRPPGKKVKRDGPAFSEEQIYEMFVETAASKLEEKDRERYLSGKRNKAVLKMLRIMAKKAYEVAVTPSVKTNKAILFDYFVPSTEFRGTVCGYNKYFKMLVAHEIIFRSTEYSHIRANGQVQNKCKNLKIMVPPEIAKRFLDAVQPVKKEPAPKVFDITADEKEMTFPDFKWDPQPEIDFSACKPKEEKVLTAEEIEFEKAVQEQLKKETIEIPQAPPTELFHNISTPLIEELKAKLKIAKEEAHALDKKSRREHMKYAGYSCFPSIKVDIFEAKREATARGIEDYLTVVDEKMADRAHIVRIIQQFWDKEDEIKELEYLLNAEQVKEKNKIKDRPPNNPNLWYDLHVALTAIERRAEQENTT